MKHFLITFFLLFAMIGISTSSGENSCYKNAAGNAPATENCLQMCKSCDLIINEPGSGPTIKAISNQPISVDAYYAPLNPISHFILLQ